MLISRSLSHDNGSAHHQIQINIVRPQTLQAALNAVRDEMMPCIIQLGR